MVATTIWEAMDEIGTDGIEWGYSLGTACHAQAEYSVYNLYKQHFQHLFIYF